MAILRKAAEDEGSPEARLQLLAAEAGVAAALGEWRRAVDLRGQAVDLATKLKPRGAVIRQQTFLANALRGAGQRRAMEKLIAELLPEVERHGLRGIARELRAMLAS